MGTPFNDFDKVGFSHKQEPCPFVFLFTRHATIFMCNFSRFIIYSILANNMQEHSAMFDLTVTWKHFQRGVFERRKTSKGVEWVENVRIRYLLKIESPNANDDRALHTKCIGFSVVDWLLCSPFLALLGIGRNRAFQAQEAWKTCASHIR